MYAISTLLERLPNVSQARFISSGYGLWLVWQGPFNNAVAHTLHDHGVARIVEGHGQSLWISFSDDVFRALAKLQIWSKMNQLPLFCQIMPVTALVGYDLTLGLSVSRELAAQQTTVTGDLEILVHPKLLDAIDDVPGLTLGRIASLQNLAAPGWAPFIADPGMHYDSPACWYGVVKALGRLSDREALAGWRAFLSVMLEIFQRLGIRHISDDTRGFVVFPLENYRQLRLYCTEISSLIKERKAANENYWPCVLTVTEQRGMSLSVDLPNRLGLDWDRLTPDLLHMRCRLGFALMDAFKMGEVGYGAGEDSLDAWCNVTLLPNGEQAGSGAIEMPLPRRWLTGTEQECFYCGFKNHTPGKCPARSLPAFRGGVWAELGRVGLKDMAQGFKNLDAAAEKSDFVQQTGAVLAAARSGDKAAKGVEPLLVRAMFALSETCQPGLLPMLSRIRNREWPVEPGQLAEAEPWPLAEAFAAFLAGDGQKARDLLRESPGERNGRSFAGSCLEGFIALNAGDAHMAHFYWDEAGRNAVGGIQTGYAQFLQARLHEVQGEFREAVGLYRAARFDSSRWLEPAYREGVCLVKMGFTGQALEIFADLARREPTFFNRVLVDAEIGRGRVHVLSGLWDMWREAQTQAMSVAGHVDALLKELPQWFDEDHEFRKPATEHLQRMHALAGTENYVAFRELVRGMEGFSAEMQKRIDAEIRRIRLRVQAYAEHLRAVQYEAGWFPFPKLLRDFNGDFNFCVKRINWIMTQNLREAKAFRTANRYLPELEERQGGLAKRLVRLRIVRDSSLFALLMGKNFIWMEVVGLALALLTIPVLLYYSGKVADNWIIQGILAQKWAFQKGLIFLVTLFCLGAASLKSVLGFEKKRNQLFAADATRRSAPPAGKGKGAKSAAKTGKPAVAAKEGKAAAKPAKGKEK